MLLFHAEGKLNPVASLRFTPVSYEVMEHQIDILCTTALFYNKEECFSTLSNSLEKSEHKATESYQGFRHWLTHDPELRICQPGFFFRTSFSLHTNTSYRLSCSHCFQNLTNPVEHIKQINSVSFSALDSYLNLT